MSNKFPVFSLHNRDPARETSSLSTPPTTWECAVGVGGFVPPETRCDLTPPTSTEHSAAETSRLGPMVDPENVAIPRGFGGRGLRIPD